MGDGYASSRRHVTDLKPPPAGPAPGGRVERRGLVIHVDGQPTLLLNSWVMTRPQDWAPAARAILWPERA